MSRPSVRRFRKCASRTLVTLLVLSIMNVSVPAFAGQNVAPDGPQPSERVAVPLLPVTPT